MVPRTVKLGTVDARRFAVVGVVVSQHDARAGAGVLCVVMVMTEGAYALCLQLPWPVISNDLTRGEPGQNPGNNLHVSGLSSRVDTRDLEAAFAKIGRVSEGFN